MFFDEEKNIEQGNEFEAEIVSEPKAGFCPVDFENNVSVKVPRKPTYEDFVSLNSKNIKKKLDRFFLISIGLLGVSILIIIILIILGNNKII
ncbi:hypothetical protein [Mycoplasma phocimorsus]|uniref:Uncharacterized protein n=1 Tax=Mycoplasma phocimorsus TaxID=3045839 RepID=A0AAJ1UVT1_9MOLU|nr:hypothetical protein [Mycoplasma phocimorsus]MDJ1645869.1 hypothetical protein [Mycoplasma phocimorsus]MDJ1646405.1 hypothetical protein [Mycoplasma phocimorsus]MDJ1647036.1 hypothetical protein [Mycoplasma phocimorsus]MDJ1647477.1 hypothetical protein [Mycoplasma phocimorsus]MDJ1647985.1 hypothetical protein [Mycoplasma phocimorsus]